MDTHMSPADAHAEVQETLRPALERLTTQALARGTAPSQWLAQARAAQGQLAGADSGSALAGVLLALIVPLEVPPELALDYLTVALGRSLDDATGAASSSASGLDRHEPLCTPAHVSLALLELHCDEAGRRTSSSVSAVASLLLEYDVAAHSLPSLEAVARTHDAPAWTAILRVASGCARMCTEAVLAQDEASAILAAGWLTAGIPALIESARATALAADADEQSVQAIEVAFAKLRAALDAQSSALISSDAIGSVLDSLRHSSRPRRASTAAAAAHTQDEALAEQERALRAANAALPPLQTWRLDVWDISQLQLPGSTEPQPNVEIVHLLHLLVDEQLPWTAKVEAARTIVSVLTDAADASTSATSIYETFYLSIFLAAVTALTHVLSPPPTIGSLEPSGRSDAAYVVVWRAALCGMLPALVASLESEREEADTQPQHIMGGVFKALLSLTEARLVETERVMLAAVPANSGEERGEDDMALDEWLASASSPPHAPLRGGLLRAFVDLQLMSAEDAVSTSVAGALADAEPTLMAQAGGEEALAADLADKMGQDDLTELLNKIAGDYGAQPTCARQLVQMLSNAAQEGDLERMARVSKALLDNASAVDVMALYVGSLEVLLPFATLLDRADLGEIADEPSVLCSVLLFAQWLLSRTDLAGGLVVEQVAEHARFLPRFARSCTAISRLGDLEASERELVARWIRALYESDGISDELMRDSAPQDIMRLAPLLFSQSIAACNAGIIDLDTLRGGLTYFAQDLLCFALPGALRWVMTDLQRVPVKVGASPGSVAQPNSRAVHYEILSTFLTSDGCSSTVAQLVAPDLRRVLRDTHLAVATSGSDINVPGLRSKLEEALEALPSPSRSTAWLSPALGAALMGAPLDSVRPHAHLVQATARRDPVSEVLAAHLRDTLALAPALPALKRSLACMLAFDHFRPAPASPAAKRQHALVSLVTRQTLDEPAPPSASAAETLGLALTLLQHASSPDSTAAQQVGQLLALRYAQALAGPSSEALNACAAALVTLATQTPLIRSEMLPVFPALSSL